MSTNFIDYMPSDFRSGSYSCTFNPNKGYVVDCDGKTTSSSSSGSTPPATTPLPNITKSFTLYKNQLPITIPSTADPLKDPKYVPGEDKKAESYWLSGSGIPSSGYSDYSTYFDDSGNQILQGDKTKWTGFLGALSKCIELDGTNGKPNCYAVSVQSDFTGVKISDLQITRIYKYKLVGLPTEQSIRAIDTNRETSRFATDRKIDSNFLFCHPQYYTWVKDLSSGVYNQYAPRFGPGAPSGPSGQLTCPGEKYLADLASAPLAQIDSSDFWAPKKEVPIPFYPEPQPPKENNVKKYIKYAAIAVVVLGLLFGIYFWYTNYGPGATPALPIVPTTSTNIKKIKGGYYYY